MSVPVRLKPERSTKSASLALFCLAGSETGGITVTNPILPEENNIRHCLALAPDAIAASAELASLRVERSNRHVNSKELTIDYWINAMRTEGARVIDIKTTM